VRDQTLVDLKNLLDPLLGGHQEQWKAVSEQLPDLCRAVFGSVARDIGPAVETALQEVWEDLIKPAADPGRTILSGTITRALTGGNAQAGTRLASGVCAHIAALGIRLQLLPEAQVASPETLDLAPMSLLNQWLNRFCQQVFSSNSLNDKLEDLEFDVFQSSVGTFCNAAFPKNAAFPDQAYCSATLRLWLDAVLADPLIEYDSTLIASVNGEIGAIHKFQIGTAKGNNAEPNVPALLLEHPANWLVPLDGKVRETVAEQWNHTLATQREQTLATQREQTLATQREQTLDRTPKSHSEDLWWRVTELDPEILMTGNSLGAAVRGRFETFRQGLPHDPQILVLASVAAGGEDLAEVGGLVKKVEAARPAEPGVTILACDPFRVLQNARVTGVTTVKQVVEQFSHGIKSKLREYLETQSAIETISSALGITDQPNLGNVRYGNLIDEFKLWVEPNLQVETVDGTSRSQSHEPEGSLDGPQNKGPQTSSLRWAQYLESLKTLNTPRLSFLEGGAGAGKSMLLRKLHEELRTQALEGLNHYVPVDLLVVPVTMTAAQLHFALLPGTNSPQATQPSILASVEALAGKEALAAWLVEGHQVGRTVLFVDGADQIDGVDQILNFFDKETAGNSVLSGRPSSLTAVSRLQVVTVQPLSKARTAELVEKYCKEYEPDETKREHLGSSIMTAIEGVPELGTSPLLTTMLCWVVAQGLVAPKVVITRTVLFETVVNHLFGDSPEWRIGIREVLSCVLQKHAYIEGPAINSAQKGPLLPPSPRRSIPRNALERGLLLELQAYWERHHVAAVDSEVTVPVLMEGMKDQRILVPQGEGNQTFWDAVHPSIMEFLIADGQAVRLRERARAEKATGPDSGPNIEVINWVDDTCDLPDWELVHIMTVGLLVASDRNEGTNVATGLLALIYGNDADLIPAWARPTKESPWS
jgi:hypothetical protein